jgi:hypothetical protein
VINRIGFFRSPAVVPNYINHFKDTIMFKLETKFAVILDITDMLTHSREVQENIHMKGMKQMANLKPSIAITVLPKDDISTMQAKFMARSLNMEIKGFQTLEEAEAFLIKHKENHKE